MKLLTKYQYHLISIGIIALIIGLLFHKPLTGEYTFGLPEYFRLLFSQLSHGYTEINGDTRFLELYISLYPSWHGSFRHS